MCRNIRILVNFEPPSTEEEIHAAALQYVRKVSGTRAPGQKNQEAFDAAVAQITAITKDLLGRFEVRGPPRNREEEKQKARERNVKRFGPRPTTAESG
jgi:hypothetical protein